MSNMKIVIIGTVASSFYGFRLDLIKELILRKYQVYAFISEYSCGELEKIRELGVIPIVYNLNRGGLNPFSDIKTVYQLADKIKIIQPDLVFSFFVKPVIWGTLAARLAKVPHVVGMLEGLGYSFTEQPEGLSIKAKLIKNIQAFLYRIALPKLDKLIFLNPDDPKDLLDRYQIEVKQVEILGGIGLNLEDYPYTPIPSSQKIIRFLFIGRLLREKGIYEFISAAKIVKSVFPNTIFTVLGSIDDSNPGALTQSQLDSYIQSGLIEYAGQVSNVAEWIKKSHIFVLPSYYREGVPRSTQEAMAVGRPVITTDVPGCRETVENGVNGFLVPKWNSERLAEKMIYFIENPKQINIMGQESYRIAKDKFDSHKVNERLLKIMGL